MSDSPTDPFTGLTDAQMIQRDHLHDAEAFSVGWFIVGCLVGAIGLIAMQKAHQPRRKHSP